MNDEHKAGTKHPCAICGLMIKGLFTICMRCGRDLNKRGLCAKCGTSPRKPKASNGAQSRYCESCQSEQIKIVHDAAELRDRNRVVRKHRGQDHREYTRETKWGID